VVGRAGVGKTQWALTSLCLAAAAVYFKDRDPVVSGQPSSDKGRGGRDRFYYFDTEGSFHPLRLVEIATHLCPSLYAAADAPSVQRLLEGVTVIRPATTTELLRSLQTIRHSLVQQHTAGDIGGERLRFIVVDSVAHLVRRELSAFEPGASGAGAGTGVTAGALAARTEALASIASSLKALSEEHNAPVLVVNQVMGTIPQSGGDATGATAGATAGTGASIDDELTPALGPAWTHFVNTRLVLDVAPSLRGQGLGSVTVAKSPCAPRLTLPYQITAAGIQPLNTSSVPDSAAR
jgi:RecA/RadA recombinase